MNLARKQKYRKFYFASRKKLVRCRCQKCKARRSLRKPLRDYVREPKCFCGGPLRIDWYRTTGTESRAKICHCGSVHYPHRKGWCAALSKRYGKTG